MAEARSQAAIAAKEDELKARIEAARLQIFESRRNALIENSGLDVEQATKEAVEARERATKAASESIRSAKLVFETVITTA